jgi:hypothetical protein
MRTLETGAGHTTLMFAEAGCVHTAVTAAADEPASIRVLAAEMNIELDTVDFVVEPSQVAMPKLTGAFDLILIDGGHGFPIPSLDFYYSAQLLKIGGILVVDDVRLWPIEPLVRFLEFHPDWEHVETVKDQTAFFKMLAPYRYLEWRAHPYSRIQSERALRRRYARLVAQHTARGEMRQAAGILWRRFIRGDVSPVGG